MPSTVQQFWLNTLLVRRSSDVEARLVCRRGVWLSRGNHNFTHSPAKSAFPVTQLSVLILGQGTIAIRASAPDATRHDAGVGVRNMCGAI